MERESADKILLCIIDRFVAIDFVLTTMRRYQSVIYSHGNVPPLFRKTQVWELLEICSRIFITMRIIQHGGKSAIQ